MSATRMQQGFDLETSYLVLADGPAAKRIDVGLDFWQTIDQRDDLAGRLVGVFRYDADWKSWEMHPDGDEIVLLLEGSVDLLLDDPRAAWCLAHGQRACARRGAAHHAGRRNAASRALASGAEGGPCPVGSSTAPKSDPLKAPSRLPRPQERDLLRGG